MTTIQPTTNAAADATVVRADPAPGGPPEQPARRERWRAGLRTAGPIIGLVLGMKALVFAYGIVFLDSFQGRHLANLSDRFGFWAGWDAPHYLSIAEHGYQSTGDPANFIVFFPGYPLAVRALHAVMPGSLLGAAFVVSGIGSVAAALLLAKLVRIDTGDPARAQRAVWFLLIFPTAYFLHIPYTESLFLTFVLGAFVAARSERWVVAGILGALAAFTRINGILLVPALAVEAYSQYRRTGRVSVSWLSIAAVGLGLLAYLGLNQHVFGDPFHFQEVQNQNWHKQLENPFTAVKNSITNLKYYGPDLGPTWWAEDVFLAIGLVAAIAAFRWSRPAYGVWALLNVLLFASTSMIQSTPRYAITIFPIFLLLAGIDRQLWLSRLVSAWSLAAMAWFTALFAAGHWAF